MQEIIDSTIENTGDSEQDMQEQMRIRLTKLTELCASGHDPFQEVAYDVSCHTTDITEHFEDIEGKEVRVAGRLLSRRGMGKASFCDLYDRKGGIQLFTKVDEVGPDAYALWQK